jgi:squalene-associated FAD-dependent desaturase
VTEQVTRQRVVVIGGGLAGLAAALQCADAGAKVTLYEARARLGGATFSFRRNGYWLDNGQHVALRCCTEYRGFLRRLGVEHLLALQPALRIPVLAEGGRRATLDRSGLPAPFHLTSTLLRYRHLSIRERFAACRAGLALRSVEPSDPEADRESFGNWLRAHGQSERAVATLWNLIALPTLNLQAGSASLALAAKVFREGLLDTTGAADVAVPLVPLQQLHAEPAAAALERLGAQVVTSARVLHLDSTPDGVRIDLTDGSVEADAVVVAVPHEVAPQLLPPGALDEARTARLGASPIVNLHFHYDRVVLHEPFAAAVASPVQWMFDRTGPSGIDHGQLVSVSISGADREIGESVADLRQRYVPAMRRLLAETQQARLLDFFVTREPRATFRAEPGVGSLRAGTRTPVRGLYLAGAWTDTGWPATMEGAVRSGLAAARAVLAEQPVRTGSSRGRLEQVA